jgi:hypothetical protein
MTRKSTIFEHFGPTIDDVRLAFQCSYTYVTKWPKDGDGHVPRAVAMEADWLSGGEVPYIPADYGRDDNRAAFKKPVRDLTFDQLKKRRKKLAA